MTLDLAPPWDHLTWMTPLSEERAARLVAFLTAPAPDRVLDVGCGWAELLLRVAEASPGSQVRGIDSDAAAVAQGRDRAAARGLGGRVRLDVGDGRVLATPDALASEPGGLPDAAVCIGASHTWRPLDEENPAMAYASALGALRALLPRGGRLVYGEGIWSQPPTETAVAGLSGRLDECVPLVELLDLAVDAGFAVVAAEEACLDEWDVFESGYAACYARWLADHPSDHPDAERVRAAAARQRAAYAGGYRGVLGLAYLSLVAV